MRASLYANLSSGLFVALIALPLSMGISVASGFPPTAGVITAIVGGIVTGFIGGAGNTIKGPAAGMIVTVLAAVTDFRLHYPEQPPLPFVGAVVIVAGVLQIALGFLKYGRFAGMIPKSVIHGMLAAIGVIIIGKQAHIMFGVSPSANSTVELYAELPSTVLSLHPGVAVFGLASFLIMMIWGKIPHGFARKLPAALVVVGLAILSSLSLGLRHGTSYTLLGYTVAFDSSFFITVPHNILSGWYFPNFELLTTFLFWKHVIFFTLVGSVESALTVAAMNSLTGQDEAVRCNEDLVAVGVGNMTAGLFGGLPMISEIVRSKASVDSGATSHLSNLFHGLLLLGAIVVFPGLLQYIPTAALAGMLVYVGMRLAALDQFRSFSAVGYDQAFFFLTTLVVTILTDLLVGVVAGIVLYIAYLVVVGRSWRGMFKPALTKESSDETCLVSLSGPGTFLNASQVIQKLRRLKEEYNGRKVTLDLSKAPVLDHMFLVKIDQEIRSCTRQLVQILGVGDFHVPLSSHPLATRVRKR